MNRYPINGKNILWIEYDERTQILTIGFKLKLKQRYYGLDIDQFVALMKANDTENYFFSFIHSRYVFEGF